MEQIELQAQSRLSNQASALRKLRESGRIPGVVYGHTQEPVSVSVPEHWFNDGHVRGKVLVRLNVDGESIDAMVRDYQRDPITRRLQHVDFYRVDMQSKIDASVAVRFHGVEQVEKRGGIVQQQLREIEIRALPSDTPQFLSVDVGTLQIGDHISVSDILLPPGAELRSDPNEVIASVVAPKQTVNSAVADEPKALQ